ncbi:MAG: hypothetical protein GY854_13975 [Deltaproteobacteria bacterium]|nr:hypothetical protein [Deltaproteobacteria bacterium]
MRNSKKRHLLQILMVLSFGLPGWACSGSGDTQPPLESRPSPGKASVQPVSKPAAMVFEGPGEMLPREVGDFKIASNPRYFGPDNLFDLINGGAEIYTEFGLKKMVTADFRSDKSPKKTVTIEIYDQGSVLGAFGRMARFLTGRTDPSKVGAGLPADLAGRGLFGGTNITFFKDHYLVNITWLDESASSSLEAMTSEAKSALPGFAQAVAAKIPANPTLPKELGLFPAEYRIDRTDAWDPGDAAGIDGLGEGFSVRYGKEKATWTLVATEEHKDTATAESKAKALQKKHADRTKSSFAAAGKRVVGYFTYDEAWTDADAKVATAQTEKLRKAFEK